MRTYFINMSGSDSDLWRGSIKATAYDMAYTIIDFEISSTDNMGICHAENIIKNFGENIVIYTGNRNLNLTEEFIEFMNEKNIPLLVTI